MKTPTINIIIIDRRVVKWSTIGITLLINIIIIDRRVVKWSTRYHIVIVSQSNNIPGVVTKNIILLLLVYDGTSMTDDHRYYYYNLSMG